MTQQWKLVPFEPTDEQVKACSHDDHGGLVTAWYRRAIYAAMIAAAPTPPASAQDDAKEWRGPVMEIITGVWDREIQIDHATDEIIDLLSSDDPAAGDARAVAALAELVACDRIKKQIASLQACVLETEDDVQELDAMMSDLARRQPAAWDAARAVVAASQQQEG